MMTSSFNTPEIVPPRTSGKNDDCGSRPSPNRRRDKLQLSCNLCRRRKVRCDRRSPCGTCLRRGFAHLCNYDSNGQETVVPRSAGTVHERLHQLESLVVSLMRQDKDEPVSLETESDLGSASRMTATRNTEVTSKLSHSKESPNAAQSTPMVPDIDKDLPSLLDSGGMTMNGIGTAEYVGGIHWASILNSIDELKIEMKHEEVPMTEQANDSTWPQLLYGCERATATEILSSVPPRYVVDRFVSTYFTMDIAPAVLHRGKFLREYDRFWQDPYASPIIWVGLLFTIMCLGADPQQYSLATLTNPPPTFDSDPSILINTFRKRTVQCLWLGKYTSGGPHVLETLIQYFMIEHFLRDDAEFEIWIMLHMLIPIALRMGLHRDPKHFSGISAFAGEMQRRLWATIFQIDIGYSALAGLPRIIKPQQCDTEEPRNLQDDDFDEEITELPSSRPESQVTPVLWVLAKQRLIPVGGIISDLAHDTRPYPYTELRRIENLLRGSQNSLPSSMKWQLLSQSNTEDSQTIMQRIYLDLFFHKMLITLYKKYLSISVTTSQYHHARVTCLDSAMMILEYQHLLGTTQFGNQVSSARWRISSLLNHDFLLAASILCFYLKLDIGDRDATQTDNIRLLLRQSHDIWLRSSSTSKEAWKAVRSLGIILEIEHGEGNGHGGNEAADYPAQVEDTGSWQNYQDYLASFSLPSFGFETSNGDQTPIFQGSNDPTILDFV